MRTLRTAIDEILVELRALAMRNEDPDLDALARVHELEPWIVRRLAESVGFVIEERPERVRSAVGTTKVEPEDDH